MSRAVAPRLLAVFLGLVAAPARAGGPDDALPPAVAERVEALVAKGREALQVPGLSAAVAAGGKVRWSRGLGIADVENEVPATAETVYRLASVTKPITAVAVLQLAEQDKIDLDAPIQDYVGRYPEKDWKVTPRLLLAHLGGVRHYKSDEWFSQRHYFGIQHAVTAFASDPLAHRPGTKFLYSTHGYNLLGAAVEQASGIRYNRYIHEHIAGPAGAGTLRVDEPGTIIPHRAHGYVRTPSGVLRNSLVIDNTNRIPGAGLCGTAGDVARFAIAAQDGTLLKPETVAQMLTPQRTRDGKAIEFGLGWHVTEHKNHREAWHGGAMPRVSTMLYTRPDDRVVVVLLCNLENVMPRLFTLAREVADSAAEEAGN